jgi:rubrerythrin
MNILSSLYKLTDDNLNNTKVSRSGYIDTLFGTAKKVALAAVATGVATSVQAEKRSTAEAQTALTDALQLALTLEYLEDEFYAMGLAKAGLIPAADRAVIQQISKHEAAHVSFLKAALTSMSVTPVAKPTFDFTVKGNFQPFTDYNQFMVLAQAFEDTGVRAYKGQAGNVASNKDVLQAALQIHAVEARHAAQIRRMRGNKGWIELGNGGNMPAATNAVYAGEQVTTQAGFNTATAFGAAAGSAAFDETLSGADATVIASLFIVK